MATSMAGEAKKVFGTIDSTVQKILGGVTNIISGGVNQMGFNQAELNAKRAVNTEATGAEARNLKAAALSSGAAVGGGNSSLPSGAAGQLALDASIRAAQDRAAGENQIVQQGYETGRDNFWKANQIAESAPGMYSTANAFNANAVDATKSAEASQQSIDTQKGWWKPLVMKLGTGLLGAATGGVSSAITGGVGSLFSGGKSGGADITSLPSGGSTAGPPNPFSMNTGSSNMSSLFPATNPTIPSFG